MRLDDKALKQLFLDARTHRAWQPREVPDSLLKELVDLMKMGPTANNCLPARIMFVKSKAAKERLKPHLSSGQRRQDHDGAGLRHHRPRSQVLRASARRARTRWPGSTASRSAALTAALRNGSLQGAYFMMAARALGLDCGPMSGFDNAGVDKEFFAGTDCQIQLPVQSGLRRSGRRCARAGPRFAFEEMASIL